MLRQQMSISLSMVMAKSGLALRGEVVSRVIFCYCGEAEAEAQLCTRAAE